MSLPDLPASLWITLDERHASLTYRLGKAIGVPHERIEILYFTGTLLVHQGEQTVHYSLSPAAAELYRERNTGNSIDVSIKLTRIDHAAEEAAEGTPSCHSTESF